MTNLLTMNADQLAQLWFDKSLEREAPDSPVIQLGIPKGYMVETAPGKYEMTDLGRKLMLGAAQMTINLRRRRNSVTLGGVGGLAPSGSH